MKGLSQEERKQLKADIVEYRKQGHYVRECCEHFNVKPSYVYLACRGIDYSWKYDTETMSKAAIQQNKERHSNESFAIKHINLKAQWCEYVDGYLNWRSYINVRCKTCGRVINISFNTIRGGTSKCVYCGEIKKQKANEEAAKAHEAKIEQKRVSKLQKMKCRQTRLQECNCCGELFATSHHRMKYCSNECMKKAQNAITKDKRIRVINSRERDTGITLEKLYQKSKGVCAICGGLCDWSDYDVIKGIFIAGNNYPSVDHIMPLSRGGKHKWSNIQLAHRICNTKKGNAIALPSEAV